MASALTFDAVGSEWAAAPTPLIGRVHDIAALRRLLVDERASLVTLIGPPGVGKTRLALAVAADVARGFADGVSVVDLAATRDPALVLPAVAHALGVQAVVEDRLPAALAAHLHGRQVLLVLDTLEQVRDVAGAVEALAVSCPALTILATSREPLRLRRERVFPVPPLMLPGGAAVPSVDQVSASAAVALFVGRAQAADPAFALTPDNAAAVAELCVRLDGLPLAIELAAAQVRTLMPAAMLHQLSRLRWEAADLPPRQRSLWAAIEWSYDLLAPPQRAMLARLAVFPSGFSLDAAMAVTDPAALGLDGLAELAALVDKGLARVLPESPQSVDEESLAPRFTLLHTVRDYAYERLVSSGDEAAVRDRHAASYLALAERAAPLLRRPVDEHWLERLETEHANLRVALAWVQDPASGGEPDAAVRLATALWYFWWVRGDLDEGRQSLAAALARCPEASPTRRGNALAAAGQLAQWQGDFAPAAALLEEAVACLRRAGDARGEAFALTYLGIVCWRQGEAERGAALQREAVALSRQVDDPWQVAIALLHNGVGTWLSGNPEEAAAQLAEAVGLFRQAGETHLLYALAALAEVVGQFGETVRATELLMDALGLSRARADRSAVAFAASIAAGLLAGRGEPAAVARLLGVADGVGQTIGWHRTPFEAAAYDRAATWTGAALAEDEFARALAAGGAIAPRDAVEVLIAAIAAVPPEVAAFKEEDDANPLSPRERQVLALVAAGHSNREIGAALAITERTATFHVTSILNKLGAGNRAQAVALAAQRGFVAPQTLP